MPNYSCKRKLCTPRGSSKKCSVDFKSCNVRSDLRSDIWMGYVCSELEVEKRSGHHWCVSSYSAVVEQKLWILLLSSNPSLSCVWIWSRSSDSWSFILTSSFERMKCIFTNSRLKVFFCDLLLLCVLSRYTERDTVLCLHLQPVSGLWLLHPAVGQLDLLCPVHHCLSVRLGRHSDLPPVSHPRAGHLWAR